MAGGACNDADHCDAWENAPCGYAIVDSNGHVARANPTFSRWLQYESDALIGTLFDELLTAEYRNEYQAFIAMLPDRDGEMTGITVDLVTARGTVLPLFLTVNIAPDPAAPQLRIVLVDATDRRAFARELEQERGRAETEHQRVQVFAETLRRALLPPVLSPPAGLDAVGYYFTASVDDVGGDFYDLFPLSRTTWGFFLGDVAGKGVEAAVITGLTRYSLRAAAVFDDDPAQVLHNLNSVLNQELRDARNRFATVIYGLLTRSDNGFDVELASGGHPPPLLLQADGAAYYADTIGGQAVGLTDEPQFVTSRFTLGPGDTLVLYTDGLTEASTGRGRERYDDEGALLQFAKSHAPATASAIVQAVHGLLDGLGSGVEDDTAVLAFGVPQRFGLQDQA